jgi:hypothetical protein
MSIMTLSAQQLRAAADLKENIDSLQNQLNELLGGEIPAPEMAPEGPRNGRRKKRRRLSPEGRANIIAAAKARWAARRGEAQTAEAPAAEPMKRKRRISRALREARSAAMKARWAQARRAGMSSL